MDGMLNDKVYGYICENIRQFTYYEGEILPQMTVDDLDADSLDMVEIIMACEDQFEIGIDDNVAVELKTVEDLYKCVKNLKGGTA